MEIYKPCSCLTIIFLLAVREGSYLCVCWEIEKTKPNGLLSCAWPSSLRFGALGEIFDLTVTTKVREAPQAYWNIHIKSDIFCEL